MKYFTKKLWSQINDIDENVRQQAQQVWSQNTQKYLQEFEKVRELFPSKFLRSFFSRSELHDYVIQSILLTSHKKGKQSCQLQMENGDEIFMIELCEVQRLHLNLASFDSCINGQLRWGYCEFGTEDRGTLKMSVICDIENELNFEFKSIKFTVKRARQ